MLLIFTIDQKKFALDTQKVFKVLLAAEPTRIDNAPPIVLGALDVFGEIIPILDFRKRLGVPTKAIGLHDKILIAFKGESKIGFFADEIDGTIETDAADFVPAEEVWPGIEFIEQIAQHDGSLYLMADLEKFLSADEEILLQKSMKEIS